MQQKRYHWLDWLRFGAAFLVLVCHARGGNWTAFGNLEETYRNRISSIFFAVTRPGLEAVVVFFVLSGFLVGGKVIERTLRGTFDAKAYLLDRASRLFVPLIPAICFTGILAAIRGVHISIGELLGNLLGLQGLYCDSFAGNAPLWSLAYEMWFYLLAALVGLSLTASPRMRASGLLGAALAFCVFTKLDASLLFCWCLGAIGFTLLSRGLGWGWFLIGASLALAGCSYSQFLSESNSVHIRLPEWLVPSRAVATLIMSLGLSFCVPFLADWKPRNDFISRFELLGTKLAAFSYTLYLTHYPLLGLWKHFMATRFNTLQPHTFFWFAAKIVSCLFVAWLLYLPFEAQTDRVRNWLKQR